MKKVLNIVIGSLILGSVGLAGELRSKPIVQNICSAQKLGADTTLAFPYTTRGISRSHVIGVGYNNAFPATISTSSNITPLHSGTKIKVVVIGDDIAKQPNKRTENLTGRLDSWLYGRYIANESDVADATVTIEEIARGMDNGDCVKLSENYTRSSEKTANSSGSNLGMAQLASGMNGTGAGSAVGGIAATGAAFQVLKDLTRPNALVIFKVVITKGVNSQTVLVRGVSAGWDDVDEALADYIAAEVMGKEKPE